MNKKNVIDTANPRIGIVLYPYKQHYQYDSSMSNKVDRIDATNETISVQYIKSKGNASGSFSITLKATKNWRDIIRPGDWLLIYHSKFEFTKKDSKGLKVLGNVDRVSRSKVVDPDGKIKIVYKIDGRDFGKVFEVTSFYYNPFITSNLDALSAQFIFSTSGDATLKGDPTDFIKTYFDFFFGYGQITQNKLTQQAYSSIDQVQIPQEIMKIFGVSGKKFSDLIRLDFSRVQGYNYCPIASKAFEGNSWDLFKEFLNPMMNEMYTKLDYIIDKDGVAKLLPCLVVRELPFSSGVFNKLKAHTIDDSVIMSEDLGFSDHERYNFIFYNVVNKLIDDKTVMLASQEMESLSLDNDKVGIPYIDKLSIRRYGVRRPTLNTDFALMKKADESGSNAIIDLNMAREWQIKLIEWWSNLSRTESGTIVIKTYENIRTNLSVQGEITLSSENFTMPDMFSKANTSTSLLNKQLSPSSNLGFDKKLKAKNYKIKTEITKDDDINIGNNIYNVSNGILYHLEAFAIEWTAPGYSQTSLTVIRGVVGEPGGNSYEFLDNLKDPKKQEVSTTLIERDKIKNGSGK